MDTTEAAQRFVGVWQWAWAAHDVEAILELYAQDCVPRSMPFREPHRGRDELAEYLALVLRRRAGGRRVLLGPGDRPGRCGRRRVPGGVRGRPGAADPRRLRFQAKRACSRTVEVNSSHVAMMPHPDKVTSLIKSAARATR